MSSTAQQQPAFESSFASPRARSSALLFRTDHDRTIAMLRVSLGAIMFPHGAQHLLGWFGGYGFGGTYQWMTTDLGFAGPLAALAIVAEFFGSVALLFGVFGRVAALGIIGLMLGATITHAGNGFFMNWFGALPAGQEGFEYHVLVILIAATIVIKGSGAWSWDRAVTRTR